MQNEMLHSLHLQLRFQQSDHNNYYFILAHRSGMCL